MENTSEQTTATPQEAAPPAEMSNPEHAEGAAASDVPADNIAPNSTIGQAHAALDDAGVTASAESNSTTKPSLDPVSTPVTDSSPTPSPSTSDPSSTSNSSPAASPSPAAGPTSAADPSPTPTSTPDKPLALNKPARPRWLRRILKVLEGLLSLVVGAAIGVGFVFAVSTGYQEICKARTYANMEEEAADLASASVCVTYVLESNGGASQSYGRIGSGVVFARDGSTYYAITASHVVGDADTGTYTFHVMTYASESFEEFAASSAYNGLVSYYADYLAEATIEYVSDESDLAVISFESADELGVVAVADATPNRGERICTCALIDGEPFTVTYGTITSGETTFSTRDYAGENIVLKHSAYITAGSSGSAAVNEEGELVGITIGGVTSVFGTFRCGALIPADQVQACIEEFWAQQAA